ncbi:MAG: S24 family peptidase [Acidobacteriota bacterium]
MTPVALPPPRKAEYLLLELALPGRPLARAGVLLFDPAADQLRVKLRQDWSGLADPEDAELAACLEEDLARQAEDLGAARLLAMLEDSLSNTLRITGRQAVVAGDLDRAVERLFERQVLGLREPAKILPFVTHVPVYSLRAAAGKFGADMEVEPEPEDWVKAPEDLRAGPELFAAQVVGRSMEPRIPDGSLCLFRAIPAGSRQGKLVLVSHRATSETGGEFTVKRYQSEKDVTEEGWRHATVTLEPLNPEFPTLELSPDEFQAIAEFIRVLTVEET